MRLSDKLRELRNQHGFSQEELARQTQLSLRTIQRIEQNETGARGDTLIRLAQVFGLKPMDLTSKTEKEETYLIPLLNFSALSFLIFPVLGFIVPLILWYFKRNGDEKLNETGKKLLNFQATWTLAISLIYVMFIFFKIMHMGGIFGNYIFWVMCGLYPLNFVLILINTLRSKKLKEVIYKPAIPFF
ncbi:helix-turn-helix domain-containing protein [Pedobacter miscanthi]|uniref:DNA-binding protein n=1 Tax=Pedobacter miscanthi TaxID=2259170 RepID=A0A366KNB5_9SPHI|nr:helix-turn-helix domain-containing protein [Pedobacter miscanthi]RBQ02773.1 DNA-binding protein [Pedobacter miscanthi]